MAEKKASTVDNGVTIKEAKAQETETVVNLDELLPQLSKKNNDYVFRMRRYFTDHEIPEAKQRRLLEGLVPEMLQGQREGKPALQLYGPPTAKADSLLHAPKATKQAPYLLTAIDLSLFFTGMFALVFGAMALMNTSTQKNAVNGVLPLLVMAIGVGFVFAYFNNWTRAAKADRAPIWKMVLLLVPAFLLVSFGSSALALVDSPLTRATTWPVYGIMAAIGFGGHYWMKQKYQLPGVMG